MGMLHTITNLVKKTTVAEAREALDREIDAYDANPTQQGEKRIVRAREALTVAEERERRATAREAEERAKEEAAKRAARERELDRLLAFARAPVGLAEDAQRARRLLHELVAIRERVEAGWMERNVTRGEAASIARELGIDLDVPAPVSLSEVESEFQRALGSFSIQERANIEKAKRLVEPWKWEGR